MPNSLREKVPRPGRRDRVRTFLLDGLNGRTVLGERKMVFMENIR